MTIRGIRYCQVLSADDAETLARWLGELGWGLTPRAMATAPATFEGAVFPSVESPDVTWAEIWPEGEGMPVGTMLQVVVDDADAYAKVARGNGVRVEGPMDMFGERIYFAEAPTGTKVAVLSKVAE